MTAFLNGWTNGKWALALVLALALTAAEGPVANRMSGRLEAANKQLMAEQNRLTRQLRQWKEDAATARQLAETMKDDDLDKYLAPADRASAAAKLVPLASHVHIAHLLYTLGPAAAWPGDASFPNMQGILKSVLTLEGDAPHDAAIARYLQSLSALPGRLDIEKLTVTRLPGGQGRTNDALNVHFKAELVWLASGEIK